MTGPRYEVAALYVEDGSEYFDLAKECFDADRDARNYAGGYPVVAHPPCRSWSRLRAFSKAPPGERELALLAVEQVRMYGGVLEHPSGSGLWSAAALPLGPGVDGFGGFFYPVEQQCWGHVAAKRTWLYICGLHPRDLPSWSLLSCLGAGGYSSVASMTSAARSRTPIAFALWLCEIASRCRPG